MINQDTITMYHDTKEHPRQPTDIDIDVERPRNSLLITRIISRTPILTNEFKALPIHQRDNFPSWYDMNSGAEL